MLQKIESRNIDIYTNEIICAKEFFEIYNKEKIEKEFETHVITLTHHPFATFLAKERNSLNIQEGNLVILRARKNNRKFEFITKIQKWGKFDIPKILIKTLDIKNHDKVKFEVMKEKKEGYKKDGDIIDLVGIGGEIKILYRENDFVTLFQKYRTPITIPRFIKITPELIELCFLIHGDGHYKDKFFFVNKNPEMHKFVVEKFEEILKIPSNIWRARLLFNNPANAELAKENWRNILKLEESQFYPSISKCLLNTSKFGNLRIPIDKLIVSRVFFYIFEKLKKLDKNYSLYALNGLLYAEGGARKNKQGLHKITISFSQAEKELFERILKNTGILPLTKVEQNRRFCISGWENLYVFFKIFFSNGIVPFDKHTERCKKALEGFLEHSFTKTIEKYLSILSKIQKFTIKELMEETGYLHNSIYNTLKKKQYSKFVKFDGRGINRNPFKISITNEGKEFLKLINDIREVYNEKCRFE